MITFGEHTYSTSKIECYGGVDLKIGKWCCIASGLKIQSGTHPSIEHPQVISNYPFKEQRGWDYPECKYNGKVVIENDVWICTDVSILEGVHIGNGAIIGCNSVVTKDVPDYAFVAGNPAVLKGYRFDDWRILDLLKIKWWNWDENKIKSALPDMQNIDMFLSKYAEN